MRRSLLLLALLATSGTALAAGWSTYESAFPAFPCADGWAACKSGSSTLGPGMARDAAGRPLPADARLGWFDLAPTAAFSPFTRLSAYDGAIGGKVAEAPPPPAAPPDPGPGTPPPPAGDPGRPPPERSADASSGSPERIAPTASPTSSPPAGSGSAPPPGSPASNPTAQASGQGEGTNRGTPPPTAAQPTPSAAPDASLKVAAGSGSDCSDLVKLEPAAMMGTLNPDQAKCLEGRIASEAKQTDRDKISRVLINNAEAKGDTATWERLVKRHLEDIDRSDPDLCYKYALQLSRGGVGRASGVIRWAEYALENKSRWSGNTFKSRVYTLYKLKAEAANKLWQDAETDYMTKEHTEANEAKAAKWRGTTKDYAREWLDYAKASSQDTKNAMSICVSAAGSKDFCEG